MLRGAADGLNIVVPYKEEQYYQARPSIAIARPGENNGAINLDGRFGLHPGLEALMPEWEAGNLAFVPAAGSPEATRSHFQAQDYLETAPLAIIALTTAGSTDSSAFSPTAPPPKPSTWAEAARYP